MSCKRELTVVGIKLGSRLNDHVETGGIISLLVDETMGWTYECLQIEQQDYSGNSTDDDSTTTTTAVNTRT